MLVDGWKWLSRGSRKLPTKEPKYRRTLYFYHGRDGEERTFKRYVYQRLDDEKYVLIFCNYHPASSSLAPLELLLKSVTNAG